MFNLLPEKEKREIRRQYRIRKLIVILIFVSIVMIANLILIIPSYILTVYKVNEIQQEIGFVHGQLERTDKHQLNNELDELNRKIGLLTTEYIDEQFHDILAKALVNKPSKVHITALLVQNREAASGEGKREFRIQLTGVSDTRDAIVEYIDLLKVGGQFDEVVLPIASLVSQFDTQFDINLTLAI